jgi:hypothetical protein
VHVPKSSILLLLVACQGEPQSVAECPDLSGSQRDECYAKYAADLFRQDPAGAEEVVNTQVSDSQVRDYIWLTVTREVDPSSYRYCDRIVEPTLGERCRVLVSRPHLHRELQREGGAPGGSGGGGRGGPQGARPGGPQPQGGVAPGQGGGAPAEGTAAPVEGTAAPAEGG